MPGNRTGKNNVKISGTFYIFSKFAHCEKKWENFVENAKFSRYFPMIFPVHKLGEMVESVTEFSLDPDASSFYTFF